MEFRLKSEQRGCATTISTPNHVRLAHAASSSATQPRLSLGAEELAVQVVYMVVWVGVKVAVVCCVSVVVTVDAVGMMGIMREMWCMREAMIIKKQV